MAHQIGLEMVSFTNLTEPSTMQAFTPPEWLLVAVIASLKPPGAPPHELAATQDRLFGVIRWS